MLVYQSKFWVEGLVAGEQLDYADLDAAGQPLFKIDTAEVTTDKIDVAGMIAKVVSLGGPALRGTHVVPADHVFQAGFFLTLVSIADARVAAGDYIAVDSLNFALLLTGWATAKTVNIGAYNSSGGNQTIAKGTAINYAIFKL